MAFPGNASPSLATALSNLQNLAASAKVQAQNTLIAYQSGPVNTFAIFEMLDQLRTLIGTLNQYVGLTGLNAYVTEQCPGYAGAMTADISAVINSAQSCLNWTVTNFPADAQGFLQAFKLNADGSRTPASFTSAQTAGLQTLLQTFINTIG